MASFKGGIRLLTGRCASRLQDGARAPAKTDEIRHGCDASGGVTVDELVREHRVGTGRRLAVRSIDTGADGRGTVNELVAAVNAAFEGC